MKYILTLSKPCVPTGSRICPLYNIYTNLDKINIYTPMYIE